MDSGIDKFIQGVVSLIVAAVEGIILCTFSALRLRALRRAIWMRMRTIARPHGSISGQAFLMLACILLAELIRLWNNVDNLPNFHPIADFSSAERLGALLTASVCTYLLMDLGLRVLLDSRRNRRLRRQPYYARRLTQRLEIARYLVASFIYALGFAALGALLLVLIIMFAFEVTDTDFLSEHTDAAVMGISGVFTALWFGVQFGNALPALLQIGPRLSLEPRARRRFDGLRIAAPVLLIMVVGVALALEPLLVKLVVPELANGSSVVVSAVNCVRGDDGRILVRVNFQNTTNQWQFRNSSRMSLSINTSPPEAAFAQSIEVAPRSPDDILKASSGLAVGPNAVKEVALASETPLDWSKVRNAKAEVTCQLESQKNDWNTNGAFPPAKS